MKWHISSCICHTPGSVPPYWEILCILLEESSRLFTNLELEEVLRCSQALMLNYTYLGIVSWIQLLSNGCDIVQEKLIPFSFKTNLVHVYVNSWDVLISSLYSAVLKQNHENTHYRTEKHVLLVTTNKYDIYLSEFPGWKTHFKQ